MLLAMQREDTPQAENNTAVPEGHYRVRCPRASGGGAAQGEAETTDGDTSSAAKSILDKYSSVRVQLR